jgi:DNA-binding transcriptional ArsR family regulator
VSHYMTALAMKQQGLKPATKIVLYWLADHHNGETGKCFPSINRISELSEMSRRSVEGHLETLEKLGLIKRVNQFRETGGKSANSYILELTGTYENMSDAQNLRMVCEKSAHGDTQNLRMNNLVINNLGKETNNTSSKDDGDLDFFERVFWSKYPKKVGKKAAFKSFKAVMKQVDRGNVHYGEFMTGFEKYVSSMKGKDLQYVKHFATWLNGEHWTDEV